MTDVDEIEAKLSKYSLKKENFLNFKETCLFESDQIDLICLEYSNRVLISVTDSGSFGSLLLVRQEKVPEEVIYSVRNLFGQFEELVHVFARSLVERLHTKHSLNKQILLSVGLKRENLNRKELFKFIESKIIESFKSHVSKDF